MVFRCLASWNAWGGVQNAAEWSAETTPLHQIFCGKFQDSNIWSYQAIHKHQTAFNTERLTLWWSEFHHCFVVNRVSGFERLIRASPLFFKTRVNKKICDTVNECKWHWKYLGTMWRNKIQLCIHVGYHHHHHHHQLNVYSEWRKNVALHNGKENVTWNNCPIVTVCDCPILFAKYGTAGLVLVVLQRTSGTCAASAVRARSFFLSQIIYLWRCSCRSRRQC